MTDRLSVKFYKLYCMKSIKLLYYLFLVGTLSIAAQTNVASSGTATATSERGSSNPASNAIDGNNTLFDTDNDTRWLNEERSSKDNDPVDPTTGETAAITIDFGQLYDISGVRIWSGAPGGDNMYDLGYRWAKDFTLEWSTNGTAWNTWISVDNFAGGTFNNETPVGFYENLTLTSVNAQFVRLTVEAIESDFDAAADPPVDPSQIIRLHEIEIYETASLNTIEFKKEEFLITQNPVMGDALQYSGNVIVETAEIISLDGKVVRTYSNNLINNLGNLKGLYLLRINNKKAGKLYIE